MQYLFCTEVHVDVFCYVDVLCYVVSINIVTWGIYGINFIAKPTQS